MEGALDKALIAIGIIGCLALSVFYSCNSITASENTDGSVRLDIDTSLLGIHFPSITRTDMLSGIAGFLSLLGFLYHQLHLSNSHGMPPIRERMEVEDNDEEENFFLELEEDDVYQNELELADDEEEEATHHEFKLPENLHEKRLRLAKHNATKHPIPNEYLDPITHVIMVKPIRLKTEEMKIGEEEKTNGALLAMPGPRYDMTTYSYLVTLNPPLCPIMRYPFDDFLPDIALEDEIAGWVESIEKKAEKKIPTYEELLAAQGLFKKLTPVRPDPNITVEEDKRTVCHKFLSKTI